MTTAMIKFGVNEATQDIIIASLLLTYSKDAKNTNKGEKKDRQTEGSGR